MDPTSSYLKIYFFKVWAFLSLFSHSFFIDYLTKFNFILLSFVLLLYCHIYTIDNFLDYGTLLSPELE